MRSSLLKNLFSAIRCDMRQNRHAKFSIAPTERNCTLVCWFDTIFWPVWSKIHYRSRFWAAQWSCSRVIKPTEWFRDPLQAAITIDNTISDNMTTGFIVAAYINHVYGGVLKYIMVGVFLCVFYGKVVAFGDKSTISYVRQRQKVEDIIRHHSSPLIKSVPQWWICPYATAHIVNMPRILCHQTLGISIWDVYEYIWLL